MLKRLLDIIASFFGLLILSPVLLVVSLLIKLDSKGPVFYRGERTGLHGKPFKIFKFRSMVTNADKNGPSSTSLTDSRITKMGKFIRKWKLDEFAQLINVLIGDMSLVGPRPEISFFTDQYTDTEKGILELRPGITDWASIWNSDEGGILAGAQNPDAVYAKVIRPHKLKLQLFYKNNCNMIMDLRLIFLTFAAIFSNNSHPKELSNYPTFDELRAKALEEIKNNSYQ